MRDAEPAQRAPDGHPTRGHAAPLLQFGQGRIRAVRDQGLQALQACPSKFRRLPAAMRPGRNRTGRAALLEEFANPPRTDAEEFGDGLLGAALFIHGSDHALPQVQGIRFHASTSRTTA